MKKYYTLLFMVLMNLPSITLAVPLNQTLPSVTIKNKGELILKPQSEEIIYQPWSSQKLTGKIRVVQHMAGRLSAKAINEPFIDALKAAKLPHDKFQTTSIINEDDTLVGTKLFVEHDVESNKRKYYWSSIVLDNSSAAQKTWQLSKKNSAVMVLDAQGKVLFFKEGALSQQEIESTLALIRSHLNQ